jgi:hypothetical protein
VLADVEGVRELAREMTRLAMRSRGSASELRNATKVDFHSKAADRYREDLLGDADAAEQAAEGIDQAAQALFRHADAVEECLEQIARIERWFSGLVDDAAREASRAVDGVGDATRTVLDAAGRAPLPGSPEWLEFTAELRL